MPSFTVIIETDDEIIESTSHAESLSHAITQIGNTLETCEFLFTGESFVSTARIYKVTVKDTKQ
jgi:hypothetical protein